MFTDVCGSVHTQIIQQVLIADPLVSGFAPLTGQFIRLDSASVIQLGYCGVFL